MSFCLIACFLRCISLALGANAVWLTTLPSGPAGERTPFRFLGCDMQGGDANQIQDVDAALAWMFSQFPFISAYNPNNIVSLSWPRNMEPQDLFPLTSSTYTFPTGIKVDVPCFAQTKLVDFERIKASSTFRLLNFLTYYQSQYRHLHAPGPRRHYVNGRSSVYSNYAGSNCAGSTIPEYLMTKMHRCPDWRRVLSGV
jgi:hypothetical protein